MPVMKQWKGFLAQPASPFDSGRNRIGPSWAADAVGKNYEPFLKRAVSTLGRLISDQAWSASRDEFGSTPSSRAALCLRNDQLKTALENLPVGVCMYDSAARLVLCNQRFIKMYDLPDDLSSRPVTHADVVALRVRQGLYRGRETTAAAAAELATHWNNTHANRPARVDTLTDGRFIRVVRTPLQSGGWVASHDDVTEKRRNDARIVELAHRDSLTGLANRALLREVLSASAATCESRPFALFLLDLDHFKSINDSLGHPIGDLVLVSVADRLKRLMRSSDLVARLGGDEFAIVAPDVANQQDALAIADRIIASLTEPHSIDGHVIFCGTSIGIASAPRDGDTPDRLLQAADIALYRAKYEERNTARCFQSGMIEQARERRVLESELRDAVTADQLEPYYQPIVDAASEQVIAFEALLRWRHPARGMVSPAVFIPIAEQTGLIVPIGKTLIERVISDLVHLPEHITVSMNLSPIQLQQHDFAPHLEAALKTSDVSPSRLCLEVTEAVLLKDDDATIKTLVYLRELGIRIAMDDFGTGYSSLSYLRRFPFDKIKIDRSFIQDIGENEQSRAIVQAVVDLAHGLDMQTTAEGVETKAQLDCLTAMGCNEIQGYYFGKPAPASEAFAAFGKPVAVEQAA